MGPNDASHLEVGMFQTIIEHFSYSADSHFEKGSSVFSTFMLYHNITPGRWEYSWVVDQNGEMGHLEH